MNLHLGEQDERKKIEYHSEGILRAFHFPSLRVPVSIPQSLDALCFLPRFSLAWNGLLPAAAALTLELTLLFVTQTLCGWGWAHRARFCGFLGRVSNVRRDIARCRPRGDKLTSDFNLEDGVLDRAKEETR